jgi:hypothetical protein
MNFAKLFELETKSGRRCEATQTIVKFLGNDEHGRPQHALRFLKIPMLNGKPINPQAPWIQR